MWAIDKAVFTKFLPKISNMITGRLDAATAIAVSMNTTDAHLAMGAEKIL